jgi:hypothetical protein
MLVIGEVCLIQGQTLPAELSAGTAILNLEVKNHVIGSEKSDGSRDHEWTFQVRAETRAAALAAIAANTVQWHAMVTNIRD